MRAPTLAIATAPILVIGALILLLSNSEAQQTPAVMVAQDQPSAIDSLVRAARRKSASLTPAEKKATQELFAAAYSLFGQGDFASARRGFDRGLGVDPADATAHFYLAEALVRLKDASAAREHYEMARALSPNSAEGLRAATALEETEAKQRTISEAHAVQENERVACAKYPGRVENRGGGVLRQCGSGIEWTQADSGKELSWDDALRWCSQKGRGWRVPSFEELARLFDATGTMTNRCGSDTCKVSASFQLTDREFWAAEYEFNGIATSVDLEYGKWHATPRLVGKRVLCVRGS